MKRREFIKLLVGSATVWPFHVRAQEPVPLVGFLSSWTADTNQRFRQAFRQGLNDTGFVEGQNVSIEYRQIEGGEYEQLPKMAADLVAKRVSVLFASAIPAALAAKTASSTIPIVFAIGSDPVDMGLVASLNRPGGNATGVTFLSVDLTVKRLELLRQLVPKIASVALLVNPRNPTAPMQTKDIRLAAANIGLPFIIADVDSPDNLDKVFSTVAEKHADALIVSADSMFLSYRAKLAELAKRYSIPTIYFAREFVTAGGLVSYSPSFVDSVHKAATYVGRILKGEKAADLPVMQPTNFEIVINLKTAKALNLTVPPSLLARADEVIE
jgi:putative tryptophan/tyrosine transport system substrate-binding protein